MFPFPVLTVMSCFFYVHVLWAVIVVLLCTTHPLSTDGLRISFSQFTVAAFLFLDFWTSKEVSLNAVWCSSFTNHAHCQVALSFIQNKQECLRFLCHWTFSPMINQLLTKKLMQKTNKPTNQLYWSSMCTQSRSYCGFNIALSVLTQ